MNTIMDYSMALRKAQSERKQKREVWNMATAKELGRILEQIKSGGHLPVNIDLIPRAKNLEGIEFRFNQSPAGILKMNPDGSAVAIQVNGAVLTFWQLYSGDVSVEMKYPEFTPEMEGLPKIDGILKIGTFDPREINDQVVHDFVNIFLEELLKWEIGDYESLRIEEQKAKERAEILAKLYHQD